MASGEFVLLLDLDAVLQPGSLARLIEPLEMHCHPVFRRMREDCGLGFVRSGQTRVWKPPGPGRYQSDSLT